MACTFRGTTALFRTTAPRAERSGSDLYRKPIQSHYIETGFLRICSPQDSTPPRGGRFGSGRKQRRTANQRPQERATKWRKFNPSICNAEFGRTRQGETFCHYVNLWGWNLGRRKFKCGQKQKGTDRANNIAWERPRWQVISGKYSIQLAFYSSEDTAHVFQSYKSTASFLHTFPYRLPLPIYQYNSLC